VSKHFTTEVSKCRSGEMRNPEIVKQAHLPEVWIPGVEVLKHFTIEVSKC
jgi:hypothetical protein